MVAKDQYTSPQNSRQVKKSSDAVQWYTLESAKGRIITVCANTAALAPLLKQGWKIIQEGGER